MNTAAQGQRGVVHDDRLQRRWILQVRERVQRGGAHVSIRVVEGADDGRGAIGELQQSERTRRNGTTPPQGAAQVTIGDWYERHGLHHGSRAGDTAGIAVVD